jgi:hypothetical protein
VPIWRDSLAKQLFSSKVKSVPTGPFANNAAESHDDIDTLFDVLQRLNENATNRGHVVLSPFWVVGGPDYASMSATGCPGGPDCAYKELLIDRSAGGLSAPYYKRGDLRRDYQAGFRRRLWYPQYHGRSHLNHGEWTASLKSDEKAQAFFNEGLATADQSRVPRGEYAMYQDEQQLVEWIKGGVDVFTKFWGFQPRVTLEPNHVCTPVLPAAFKRAGFEGVDSCYCVLPSASNNLGQQMELIERDADGNVVKVPPTMRYYADYSFGQGLECIDPRVSIDAYKVRVPRAHPNTSGPAHRECRVQAQRPMRSRRCIALMDCADCNRLHGREALSTLIEKCGHNLSASLRRTRTVSRRSRGTNRTF